MPERDESDQLPEEGPGGQVPDDDERGRGAREEAEEQAGARDAGHDDEEGQATGNPANAG